MRIFNACMKIMKRNKSTFLIYAAVFLLLLLLGGVFYEDESRVDFTEEKPSFAWFNRDKETELTKGLHEFLREKGTEVFLEDSREVWMDAGFYRAVDGIIQIPEGFEEQFQKGEAEPLQIWSRPLSASGYYLETLVSQYLSTAHFVRLAGNEGDLDTLIPSVQEAMKEEVKVNMMQYKGTKAVFGEIQQYLRFLPYVLLCMCISCVGVVFMSFQRPVIRMRTLCSPIHPTRVAVEKFLYVLATGMIFWLGMNLLGFLIFWKKWSEIPIKQIELLVLNGWMQMMVVIAVSLLCSALIRSESAQSFVTNVVSLGMCFFGGVFVPLELMGEGMRKAARFLPVYWYVENLERICSLTGFQWEHLQPIFEACLIQGGFAVAFFCVYLVINKYQQREEEDFGVIRTEVER